jgi:hypothetical protein
MRRQTRPNINKQTILTMWRPSSPEDEETNPRNNEDINCPEDEETNSPTYEDTKCTNMALAIRNTIAGSLLKTILRMTYPKQHSYNNTYMSWIICLSPSLPLAQSRCFMFINKRAQCFAGAIAFKDRPCGAGLWLRIAPSGPCRAQLRGYASESSSCGAP